MAILNDSRLELVYNGEDTAADIVVIHRPGQSSAINLRWVRHHLPKSFPGTRIFEYSVFQASSYPQNVRTQAQSLLLQIENLEDELEGTWNRSLNSDDPTFQEAHPEHRTLIFICTFSDVVIVEQALHLAQRQRIHILLKRVISLIILDSPHAPVGGILESLKSTPIHPRNPPSNTIEYVDPIPTRNASILHCSPWSYKTVHIGNTGHCCQDFLAQLEPWNDTPKPYLCITGCEHYRIDESMSHEDVQELVNSIVFYQIENNKRRTRPLRKKSQFVLNPSEECSIQDSDLYVQAIAQDTERICLQVLRNLSLDDRRLFEIIFSWLLTAYCPLSLRQTLEAVKIGLNLGYDEDILQLKNPAQDISTLFGGLIIVSEDHFLRFKSPSMREYFRSMASSFGTNTILSAAHDLVARACLVSLQAKDDDLHRSADDNCIFDTLKSYASKYWPKHFKMALPPGRIASGPLQRQFYKFCDTRSTQHISVNSLECHNKSQQFLTVGISYGIFPVVKLGLEMGADPNQFCCEHCPSPLRLAVESGCESILKLLLEHGANFYNSQTNQPENQLFDVVNQRRSDIATLLLQNGAKACEWAENKRNTPLHPTAKSNQPLMKFGSNPTKKSQVHLETPLHNSSCFKPRHTFALPHRPHPPTFEQSEDTKTLRGDGKDSTWDVDAISQAEFDFHGLLSISGSRSSFYATNMSSQTAVLIATPNGHYSALQLLATVGANVNIDNLAGRTALSR